MRQKKYGAENYIWILWLINPYFWSISFQIFWSFKSLNVLVLYLSIASNLNKYHIPYVYHTGIRKLHLRKLLVQSIASNSNKYHIPYVDHACIKKLHLRKWLIFMIFWCTKPFPPIKLCTNLLMLNLGIWFLPSNFGITACFIAFTWCKNVLIFHDDIIKWKHFLCYWLWEGNQPINCGFPSQRPVTQSFDVFSDVRLPKRINKQSKFQWFEMPSRSLWRDCNALIWYSVELLDIDSLLVMLKWIQM